MNRKFKSALAILSTACLFAYAVGCGGSSGRIEGDLTEEENNDRLGQKIIRCAVQEVPPERIEQVDEMIEEMQASARFSSRTARDPGTVVVPVVVHVIASGPSEAEGNVSDAQIAQQIAILNAGFNGSQGGIPTPFQFTLNQITRTIDPVLANMSFGSPEERAAKTALRQGDQRVLNIYVAAPQDGTLGWAYFPWDFTSDPVLDGVVVLFSTLPGGSLPPYNEGDTAVHEVGHWLGLFHTFQGGCGSPNDDVADTPAEARPAFACPVGRNTCARDPQPDAVNNFMNYSDDFCLLEFSPAQSERMDLMAAIFRTL